MMFFASLKMMLLVSLAMMRCLPLCARRHTSLGVAVIIGTANIICRRQTSFKKRTFVLVDKSAFFVGRGRRIRTRDPRFWRPVLYQLSYTPTWTSVLYHTLVNKSRCKPCISSATCCGISSMRSIVYHHCESDTTCGWWYTPAAMIYTLKRDAYRLRYLASFVVFGRRIANMPLLSQWIKKWLQFCIKITVIFWCGWRDFRPWRP